MTLIKYDPIREIRNLQEEMNRLFASAFSRTFDDELMSGAWTPNVDIYENKDQVVLEAELPGMKPEDVNISIENNVLTIQGERKFEKKEESDNYHRIERRYGSFTRSFTLPPTVDTERINAEFDNGVLRLTMAKREEAKPRRIEIKAASSGSSQKNE
ncbi:MAG: Hsp20/alpha crystallin family protein [Pyrinomonadaceae bacterium]|nr:Hsp20/alpha crystallin family protein [Pyrinomonadaceae bacterium]MCX7640623.1 Hsp20/alpha crystallin family protein [Pyrinomonadaceae bacterium]MDW8305149.1 Hsp20/alpha crystallin family protein [Acidobacteriota bacterium]